MPRGRFIQPCRFRIFSLIGLECVKVRWLAPHGAVWTFAAGFFGSAAVELVALDEIFRRSAKLPDHYRRWVFWPVRIFIAGAGGALAVAYNNIDT